MNEKILSNKKNGMGMLLLFCLLYLIAIAGCVLSAIALEHEFSAPPVIAGLVVSIIWLCIGWVPFLGLKVLKPQEALVLTLFGNYIGTLKEAGFYFVNPFCTSVNPASKTKLSQSGELITIPRREQIFPVSWVFLQQEPLKSLQAKRFLSRL